MSTTTEHLQIAQRLENETGITTSQFFTFAAVEPSPALASSVEPSSTPGVEISTRILTSGVRYHKNRDRPNRPAAFESFQAQLDAMMLRTLIAESDTNWVMIGGKVTLVDNFGETFRAANAIAATIKVPEVSETHGDTPFSTGSWTLTTTIEATYRIMTSDRPGLLKSTVKAHGDDLKRVIAAL